MKKTGLILILFFVVSTVYSASINCYIPRKGATLFHGQTYRITWLKKGDMKDRVRILLIGDALGKNSPRRLSVNSGDKIVLAEETLVRTEPRMLSIRNGNHIVLSENARNDSYQNFFRWTVSDRIPEGQYMIRVMTVDEKVVSDGRMFFIKNPEREAGYPDLAFTGRFFLGDKYVNIGKGDTIAITRSDLNKFYQGKIRYDSKGNVIKAVIPFSVNLKNIGNVGTGISKVLVKNLSGKFILNHPELKPGKSTFEKGDYMQLEMDLTKNRVFEMVMIIDPAGKILNEKRNNNKYFFVLDLKNF